ncbi:BlaI/MecI/CopY family transcriptional regulator [Humibacter ginsenosidimutans]|uniref:BlaI/MecI/CopY family transcriptional regulator n=1 Tax=Humibacter ginsenosidimutans TaxID=2599293 RepID=A0A5B8M0L7_9MICO|nr:BlaI/MecI/CopY family transcriptional regulator [Humibacter ginsenosidimutans]QDZ13796.1 BlaI/MecI/CopY family transcriptional regulator [Humibacter ginsenosidimutans]
MASRTVVKLGDLERAVMDVVWDSPTPIAATDLREALNASGAHDKDLAITTVMTVLTRLEAKGFVVRDRDARPHLYRSAMSREDHVAELMHEVLGSAADRDAVLARFVGQVTPHDAERLRKLLEA